MEEEEKKEEKFSQLRTMIPVDVLKELTDMAKQRETFKGSWDYGNTIRELLWAYKVFYNVNTRLDELEVVLGEYKQKLFELEGKEPSEEKKEKKSMFLGKHGEDDKNG